ncbi:hypothetical protein O3G_MSEX009276 [Manduca sexta]|uniref:Protein kinase C-binding protein 1 n=1 Tax=Manduca sexta TaxID=7130 RepID=A0A922CRV6_MANSE|nr:hypothetical protein O3G_MSEX009276 [Manduca sexta]
MEESSEAHMETDVSSTTEDLPDRQEVTGSNGTVEMVIVVEKVCEEDMNENNKEQLDNVDSVLEVPDEPSVTATASEEAKTISPTKHVDPEQAIQQPTIKLESPKKTLPSSPPSNKQGPVTVNTEQETVDSSSKSEEAKPQSVDSNSEITVENLVESTDSQKSDEKSNNEETQPQETSKINKDLIEPDKTSTTESTENKNNEEPDIPNNKIQVDTTMEASNDSQIETNSDTSEKEHSKSISRELKSLINSAKESKIISECTQLTSKTRKSRVMLESPNTSLNSSVEADKIQGTRRNSNNSQKSNCSEKSDKMTLKRSMRSQNPEFVSKVKQFLNSVTGKSQKDEDITDDEIEDKVSNKNDESPSHTSTPKKRKLELIVMNKTTKHRSDSYCWRCHWAVEQVNSEKAHQPMLCTVCPKSFHFKCLSGAERNKISNEKAWVCPDCLIVLHAESSETRSPAMKKISLGMLCELLQHALERMMDVNGVEPFMSPVDLAAFPDYDKYVVHPMDLSLMKANIAKGLYGSTEAFMTDAQWILHNSIIFNTLQSKLTGGARALVRSCRAEMGEIEACPECYAAAHARRPTWFTDVCSTPHILLWAKLKGFPHWPAKGMSVSAAGLVDVRFFGAHDRAWVPAKDCFLYSEKDPNNFRTKRQDILESMQEAEQHIRNISRKYGKFVYPPFKTQFEPNKLNEQLKMMIPTFEGEVRVPQKHDKTSNGSPAIAKKKSRSNSKSSKSSCNDGDISEVEDPLSTSRKGDSVDGNEDDFSTEKAKIMEVDISKTKDNKETENVKKRRRSQLEEAIITILDNYTLEKRKRMDDGKTDNTLEPSSSKEPNPKEKNAEMAKDNPVEKIDSTSKDEESTKSIAKEKSESLVVAPLKISFGAIKNGKQTVKVTNAKESPKATTSNDKTPIIALRTSTPKEEKVITAQKMKTKIDKLFIDKTKGEKVKSDKRRNSKSNKSLIGNTTPKTETSLPEKKNEKVDEPSTSTKEKPREFVTATRSKTTDTDKTPNDKNNSTPTNSKLAKERLNFDDDTTLAVIARENNKTSVITSSGTGLPTISSVRSLSTVASTSSTPTTSSISKMIEVTIEGNPNASIFTPTSTDPIRTMKEATTKLQKLRADTEPLVGRVGVRAFARMTSPDRSKNNDVQVEIKAEPIDLDDADRHMEKMDLMNAFKLRPVNPPSNLREVRMNEVVITPLNRRTATKVPEIRPRAKKTFPHPKKPEDGQLNGKNSMVYIPIQPPATQPPRITRALPAPAAAPAASAAASYRAAAHATTTANIVNTVTSPLVPVITSMPPAATTTSQVVQTIPTIGQVPTTVHTVPLMTSVNGQWMFSLQPVMSVGGVDVSCYVPFCLLYFCTGSCVPYILSPIFIIKN